MKTLRLENEFTYFGPELRPHFILETTGVRGTSIIAFEGPCEVQTAHLVDWEDKIQNDFIRAKRMIHFIAEIFEYDLACAVTWQRLWISIASDLLRDSCMKKGVLGRIFRQGDDIYYSPKENMLKKMSVSIVTASPVSRLFHFGLNLNSEGAPVEAIGLFELGFSSEEVKLFTEELLNKMQMEWESAEWARVKVKPVM